MGFGSFVKKVGGSTLGKMMGFNDSYGAITDPIGFLTGENAANAQNAQQLAFWNMQNAYNTPKAQMQRFAEAGLNPNLIYSQGNNGNAGAVGSAATGDAGSSTLSKAFSVVSAVYGLKGMKADLANKAAQNNLLDTQTEFARQQVRQLRIDNDYLEKHGLSNHSPKLSRELEAVPDSFFKSLFRFIDVFDSVFSRSTLNPRSDRGR